MKRPRSFAWLIAGFAVALTAVSPAVTAEPGSEELRVSARNALMGLLPSSARVDSVFAHDHAVVIRLELPDEYLYGGGVTDESLETLSRRLEFELAGFPDLREIHIVARDPRDPKRTWRSLPSYLPHFDRQSVAQDDEPPPTQSRGRHVRRTRQGQVPGALDGKLVFLSQCHGWLDYGSPAFWETQRGITHGIVEDFLNPEGADQFLIDYLRNAGADVFTLHESDLNTRMVIVDDGDGGSTTATRTASVNPTLATSPSGTPTVSTRTATPTRTATAESATSSPTATPPVLGRHPSSTLGAALLALVVMMILPARARGRPARR